MIRLLKFGTHYLWNNLILEASLRSGRTLTKPSQAYVLWTGRCNFRCRMCKIRDDRDKLTTAELRDVIDQLADWGVPKITISGGEPMLFKEEFFGLLDHAGKKGLFTHFATNGTGLDDEAITHYSRMGGGQITLSLDGARPETQNTLRGHGHAWRYVMDALDAYERTRPENVIFKIETVIHDENLHEVLDIYRIARERGVIFHPQPYDTQDFFTQSREVSFDDIRDRYPLWISRENMGALRRLVDRLKAIKRADPYWIMSTEEQLESIYRYFARELDYTGKCLVGYTSLFVLQDGSVTMCLYEKLGNIREDGLQDLWRSKRFEAVRREMLLCDRPCLNGCAQRLGTLQIVRMGMRHLLGR